MLPKRYSFIVADRSSGVMHRFTLAVRPTLALFAALMAPLATVLARRPGGRSRAEAPAMTLAQAIGEDVPLVGFYANGEISNNRVYGYTGVLTLFL